MDDDRHWPAAAKGKERKVKSEGRGEKPADLAAAYGAKDAKGQPVSLTLEKLNVNFDDNVYYSAPGQRLLHWGVAWKRNQAYATPVAFGEALGIETGGRTLQPSFSDPQALDFRVPPGVMKALRGSYPKGAVPGVRLGVRENAQGG